MPDGLLITHAKASAASRYSSGDAFAAGIRNTQVFAAEAGELRRVGPGKHRVPGSDVPPSLARRRAAAFARQHVHELQHRLTRAGFHWRRHARCVIPRDPPRGLPPRPCRVMGHAAICPEGLKSHGEGQAMLRRQEEGDYVKLFVLPRAGRGELSPAY